jgi:Domain of unknown function (DUF5666)
MTDTNLEADAGPGVSATDEEDEDYLQPAARRRLPWLTAALAVGLIAGLAFTGGVLVQKNHDTTSTANGLPTGLPAGLGNLPAGFPNGGAGAPGAAGAGTGTTSSAGPVLVGTVTSIDGTTVKVKDLSGTVHAVSTTSDTTLARTGLKASAALANGDTVTITGTKASDGTVTATGITIR